MIENRAIGNHHHQQQQQQPISDKNKERCFVPNFFVHAVYKSDFIEPFDLCAIPTLCSHRSS